MSGTWKYHCCTHCDTGDRWHERNGLDAHDGPCNPGGTAPCPDGDRRVEVQA